MSETAATVVKLIAALTSTKAAIKYISIGVFVVVSWKFIGSKVGGYGVPDDNIKIIIPLIGIGLGTIFSSILIYIGELFYTAIIAHVNEIKNKKEKAKQEQLDSQKQSLARKEFIETYKHSFNHLNASQRETLRNLLTSDVNINFEFLEDTALLKNGYVEKISLISNKTYLSRLNPLLKEATEQIWQEEIERHVDEYFYKDTREKRIILKLLESGEDYDNCKINIDVKNVLLAYQCIKFVVEDGEDCFLYFPHWRYCEEFKRRTGKEYQEEVFIKKDRFRLES